MVDCSTRAFAGCDCLPGQCQSAVVPIRKAIDAADTVQAMAKADIIFVRTLAVASLASIVLSFIFVGLPEMQRWEKDNQENFYVQR